MRKVIFLRSLGLLLIVVGFGSRNSFAQYVVDKPSLEWLTATSDVVVRATVVGLSAKEPRPLPAGAESQSAWITVTLKVHETLKGKHAENITFVVAIYRGDDSLQKWKDSGEELLWFLVRTKPDADQLTYQDHEIYARHELKLIRSEWGWSVIQLTTRPTVPGIAPPIFSMDLSVLDDPTEILSAVRASAREGGTRKGVREHKVALSGGHKYLVVPVDQRLEKAARRWIKAPGDILKPLDGVRPQQEDDLRYWEAGLRYERDHLRWEGVKTLGYFKSDENIGILKALLNDPAWLLETKEEGKDAGVEERVYYVREEAFETLRKWGLQVPKPVIRVRVAEKDCRQPH